MRFAIAALSLLMPTASFAGSKVLQEGIVASNSTILVDTTTIRVGIKDSSPSTTLDVNGTINAQNQYELAASTVMRYVGSSSVMVGKDVGLTLTSASHSVWVGHQLGQIATDTNYDVCIGGEQSICQEMNGSLNNICIGGQNTCSDLTFGIGNLCFGTAACQGLTGGASNLMMGYVSGINISTGINNICLGEGACHDLPGGGSGSVMLGYKAGYSLTKNNRLVIANADGAGLISGDFSESSVTVRGRLNVTSTTYVYGQVEASYFIGDGSGLTNLTLSAGVIDTTKLGSGAVTAPKLGLLSVYTGTIQDGAVDTAKLGSGAVDTGKLNKDAVTTNSILDANITAAKLVNSGVFTGDATTTFPAITISAGAIDTGKLGSGAVDTSKINKDAVTTNAILDANVTAVKLVNAGVFTGDATTTFPALTIGASAITTSKINNGAVDTTKIGSGAVDTSKLAKDAVTTNNILDANVTTAKLASGAVDTTKLGSGAVDTSKMNNAAITTISIANGAVDTNKIGSGAVDTSKLKNYVVGLTNINATGTTDLTFLKRNGTALEWAAAGGGSGDVVTIGTQTLSGGNYFVGPSTIGVNGTDLSKAWVAWTPTFTGFSSDPTVSARYMQVGRLVYASWSLSLNGTSNSTDFTMSLPVTAVSSTRYRQSIRCTDNGTALTNPSLVDPSGSTVTIYKDLTGASWTSSGAKGCDGVFMYEANQ